MAVPQQELEQINLRVSARAYEELEAAAFVRGLRSFQELLRHVVEQHAAKLAEETETKEALKARKSYRVRAESKVRELPRSGDRPSVTRRSRKSR